MIASPTTQPTNNRSDGLFTRMTLILVVLAFVVATGWRIALTIWALPMASEEFGTWRDVTSSTFMEMVLWDHHKTHPPLNYLLTKLSLTLAGSDDLWVLRLPTLFFSAVALPIGYLLGCALHGRLMGLSLVWILAFWSFLLHQAHYARMYSGTVALGLLALWILARIYSPTSNHSSRTAPIRWWILLGAALGALFWMSSAGLFLVVGIPLGVLLGAVLVQSPSNKAGSVSGQFPALDWRSYLAFLCTLLVIALPGILHYLDSAQQRSGKVVYIGGSVNQTFVDRFFGWWISNPLEASLAIIGLAFIASRWKSNPWWCSAAIVSSAINAAAVIAVGHERDRYMTCAFLCGLIGLAWLAASVGNMAYERLSRRSLFLGGSIAIATAVTPGTVLLGRELLIGYPHTTVYARSAIKARDHVPQGSVVIPVPGFRLDSLRYYGLRTLSPKDIGRDLPADGVFVSVGPCRAPKQKRELAETIAKCLAYYGHPPNSDLVEQCLKAHLLPLLQISPTTVRLHLEPRSSNPTNADSHAEADPTDS